MVNLAVIVFCYMVLELPGFDPSPLDARSDLNEHSPPHPAFTACGVTDFVQNTTSLVVSKATWEVRPETGSD